MSVYLMTGATGFVGREVLQQLLEDGQQVIVVARRPVRMRHVKWIQGDIRNAKELSEKLKNEQFDYILHLASLPGDTGEPVQMVETNVNGFLHIMEVARSHKIKRMVLASSISAYEWYPGTPFHAPDYLPVDEKHPCRPKDMYSVTKRVQELLAITYYHEYKLPIVCLRFSAVIGPNGQGGGRGWREIATELAEGTCVSLPHFSGEEVCHYVDIRDAARMVREAAVCKEAEGEIFNCCGPSEITGDAFAEITKELFPGIEVKFGYPWSMAQGGKIRFSMEKAKALMNFVPEYSIKDSMENIRQWIETGGLEDKEVVDTVQSFEAGVKKT